MNIQKTERGESTKLEKTVAAILLFILLTSGVFAVSDTDLAGSSGNKILDKSTSITRIVASAPSERTNITNISTDNLPKNKFSVSLDPKKQTSVNGEATYKVIVKALYLPSTDSIQASEYKLSFEPKDKSLQGEFGAKSIVLQPGEKTNTELKIKADNSGEHEFSVIVSDANGNDVEAEGLLSVLDSNTEPSQKIKLDLQPEKQYTESGESEYTLSLYRSLETPCNSETECSALYAAQNYELSFVSEQGSLTGEFKLENPISLKPGEKKSVPLVITAKEKGTYVFKVYAKASDYETNIRGLLVYGKDPQNNQQIITSSPYLNSEGFAMNEDQSEGISISLYLVGGNGEVRGKLVFGEDSYAVKGKVSDTIDQIDLDLYNTEDGGFDKPLGELSGEIKKFQNFLMVQGGLDLSSNSYPDRYWTVSLTSKQNSIFQNKIIVAEPDVPVTKTINKEEVVTIRQGPPRNSTESENETNKEAYILTEKIEKTKILGLIPNPWGDKLLKVKLVDGDQITEKTLKEFSTSQIGNFEVGIGSLDNEDAIEVSITKTSKLRLN